MQRSIAIISVPMIALWLIIGILAATAMYAVSIALDDKPAYAQGKGASPDENAQVACETVPVDVPFCETPPPPP